MMANKAIVKNEDLPLICRLCLSNEHLQPFEEKLQQLLYSILGPIEDEINVEQSQNICKSCFLAVQKLEILVLKCKSNGEILRSICFNRTKININSLNVGFDINMEDKFEPPKIKSETNIEDVLVKQEKLEDGTPEGEILLNMAESGMKSSLVYEDFPVICRVCLSHDHLECFDEKLQGIYKSIVNNLEDDDVAEGLLPQNICQTCALELEDLEIFFQKCKNNEESFQTSQLKATNIYIDPNSEVEEKFDVTQIKHEDIEIEETKIKQEISEIASPEKQHQCGICEKIFTYPYLLKRHLVVHSDIKPFTCSECGVGFNYKCNLRYHQRKHTHIQEFLSSVETSDTYQCQHCQKQFFNEDKFKAHLRFHNTKRSHKCTFCNKAFTFPSKLKSHLSVHSDDKSFECSYCGEQYKLRMHFLRHLCKQTSGTPHKHHCPHCTKQFACRSNFQQHLLLHTGEKRYECTVCEKAFARRNTLQDHMMLHTGEKRFQCLKCDKAFRHRSSLKNHLAQHGSERPFVCNVCGNAYKCRNSLTGHLKTHTTKKQHVCAKCSKGFRNGSLLRKHMNECDCGKKMS